MSAPKLLDLMCGASGASRGYQLAGFHVTGVDLVASPRYVGDDFHQADAMTFPLDGFDAIAASPPCQRFSDLAHRNGNGNEWPDLIDPIRERLLEAGVPYIIENVEGAPLIDPVMLDQDVSFVQVTGGGNCRVRNKRAAMGVEWMTGAECNEAIPPAYTEHLGRQLIRAMEHA